MTEKIKKTIIIHQSALGDLINTIPALKALRENSEELIGIGPDRLKLLEHCGILDRAILSDALSFYALFQEDFHPSAVLKEIFSGTDLVISWLGRASKIYQAHLAQLAERAFIFKEPFPPAPGKAEPEHITQIMAKPVLEAGIMVRDFIPKLKLPESAPETAYELVGGQPFLAIHPGSGSLKKAMPLEKLFGLLEKLTGLFPEKKLVLITGEVEKTLLFEFVKRCPEPLKPRVQLIKDLPLIRLAELLSQAGIYLGMDSGPTHLASALGIKTIALFGPTDPKVWAPPQENVKVVKINYPCAPCPEKKRRECQEAKCMEALDLEEVISLLKE